MQTGRFKIVAAAENNPNARKTYKRNLKVERVYNDIRTIDYSDIKDTCDSVDLVIGGPPCQGFSNANRQHTSIISMNNRLVKEYVRAICELQPQAFVMENVAMLRSAIHRFMVDEADITNQEMLDKLSLQEDEVEIIPAKSTFDGALNFVKTMPDVDMYTWAESFYKIINLLYRFRINQPKFDQSLAKYKKSLIPKLQEIIKLCDEQDAPSIIQRRDKQMAQVIINYVDADAPDFNAAVSAIEVPLFMQRALHKIKELSDNSIHVYEYKESKGTIVACVKSYAVRDYIKCILENEPYNYTLTEITLNAIDYGAPQKRERFIIVGVSDSIKAIYVPPKAEFSEASYRTVRSAIGDIESVEADTKVSGDFKELEPHPNASGLEKELRGKLLYNHTTTATTPTALARFKALKQGQNFHDLDSSLKTTYSDAARTQNTIYMRLIYDEPCGTVVNVRKSMWIHPVLDRAISIREAARLQTFPDSFVFEGPKDSQYQQIGNAVPPFLAKAIAKSIVAVLDSQTENA